VWCLELAGIKNYKKYKFLNVMLMYIMLNVEDRKSPFTSQISQESSVKR